MMHRLTPALCDAGEAICNVAWEHLNHQQGNAGEASKNVECWESFRSKEIALGQGWREELAEKPFIPARSEEEALAAEWERVRPPFEGDARTIRDLEAQTGKVWMKSRGGDPVCFYAEKPWEKLRSEPLRGKKRLGIPSLRGLVELFSAAAG